MYRGFFFDEPLAEGAMWAVVAAALFTLVLIVPGGPA